MPLRKDSKSDTQRTSPEGMFRFISSDGNSPPSGTARRAGIFSFQESLRFAFLVSVLFSLPPVMLPPWSRLPPVRSRPATPAHCAYPLVIAASRGHSLTLLRTASLSGFFDLSHVFDGPLRYGAFIRFDTKPSSPMRQTCLNTFGPSSAICSLKRIACRLALPSNLASRCLRSISGRSPGPRRRAATGRGRQHRLWAPAFAPQRPEVRHPVVADNHHLAVDQDECASRRAATSTMEGKRSAQSLPLK